MLDNSFESTTAISSSVTILPSKSFPQTLPTISQENFISQLTTPKSISTNFDSTTTLSSNNSQIIVSSTSTTIPFTISVTSSEPAPQSTESILQSNEIITPMHKITIQTEVIT